MDKLRNDLLETLEKDREKIQSNNAVPDDDKKFLLYAIEFAINQLKA